MLAIETQLATDQAGKPHFRGPRTNKRAIYRFCIEKGLLQRDRIAQTTFYRFVREYNLLAPDADDRNKQRLAFSMPHANQLWQADTMFGPHCATGHSSGSSKPAKLIAFCVGCLIEAVRGAKRTIDIDTVNRVLMQPHWQKDTDLTDY